MTAALIKYDSMCRAIDAAYKVDEVKKIRDAAVAWEHYSRQAHNVEAERKACEIRLRAEQKAGRLDKRRTKAKGGRPSKETRSPGERVSTSTLRELGEHGGNEQEVT